MYINLETCNECFAVFEDNNYPERCPVCRLKKEMEEKIEAVFDLVRNFHPLE